MSVYQERIPQVKQPKPNRRGNKKLTFLLVVFFLSVLAVLFFRSSYSKVQEITVYGNDLYAANEIVQASGLYKGMQFLNVWESDVREGLKPLAGIKSVSVERSFPGKITLHVTEFKRVALWTSTDGKRAPLLENGTVLDKLDFRSRVVDRPLIRAWGAPELLPQLGKALGSLPPTVLEQISDIALTPTISDKQRVTLYMRDGNEVRSVIYQIAKKLPWYPAIAKELPEGERGVVYMLESTWFSKYGSPAKQEENGSEAQAGEEQTEEKQAESNQAESSQAEEAQTNDSEQSET
ncbi:cell division protein FtsQ/DivIB [Brevibacillus migulae]|uniref:cell division protein FtsQ/DivIB n=1 Tax=Brevibacillus migulae TaxID=1644114 RepID=UPI00106EAC9E|nr:FtsQ-type POTRA domain-containing protein [Brevibacillus migulae]